MPFLQYKVDLKVNLFTAAKKKNASFFCLLSHKQLIASLLCFLECQEIFIATKEERESDFYLDHLKLSRILNRC